ncbi:39S ribosomal protein L15, mitochondrial [Patella vulgata]|uniref:39S ribosomal protein L15, mitochondrial n=1 Tax=Patella vulgata TaxID=6465 RepID=UPI0021803B66|nr:39S ribosomal protein L15, mitochondrial [Patella vulgata]
MASGITEKALKLVQSLPRLSLSNIKNLPHSIRKTKRRRRDRQHGKTHGRGHKGQGQRATLPRLGFEGNNTPFYLQIPKEPYYKDHELRKEYVPVSLLQIQRFVDLGRLNVKEPIDLSSLCNTRLIQVKWEQKQFGVDLLDEGADIFCARLNIEVQKASELTIAAIEKNGGVITTRYYDPHSLHAVVNPAKFFAKGVPIPRCKLPPQNEIAYYSDAKNRGYLADPEKILHARVELAQKYGYALFEYENEEEKEMLLTRKDPRQIFLGLAPGWVVNLKDKVILKPKDPEFVKYYKS